MTDDWNDYADGWDGNSDVRLFAARAFSALDSHAGIRGEAWQSKRVLDFGCGTGLLTELIAPHVKEVIAVDTSDRMIAVLKDKNLSSVTPVHADILGGGAAGGKDRLSGFDLICASSVCGFLPDYAAAVKALSGLLERDGRFVQWDWQGQDGGGFGLTEQQMRAALTAAGLGSIRVKQVFALDTGGQSMPVLMGSGTCNADRP
ncbi:class I SAM-dependent methyltransferase [Leisingera sp. MMG026]|uniref:class I SAM-dependent DNA methyltransferase n=1 Tax=Leisingera sp. MMG026 TaxID=2909982 RepID=UPI001F1A6F8F|nr:class I SAM-dependent methyltransferase [Leisingera sp. MMG026]MCF6430494.1 class I SAM-dependent methyltransferase [Leisingera sp. MMG026]